MVLDRDGTNENSVPFSILLERALKLRTYLDAPLKSRFTRYPAFLQNTIFTTQTVIQARLCETFEERLHIAITLKEEGNVLFRGRVHNRQLSNHQASDHRVLVHAQSMYERALSVFRYLENSNSNWRNEVSNHRRFLCKT